MKIAIIGFGSIGKRHLKNLLQLGFKNIIIISSHLPEGDYEVDAYIIPVVQDIDEVLASIDAIVISNASNLHHTYLKLAVKNNKHVYIEKPVSCETGQVKGLCEEAEDKGLVIAVGTQFRFNKRLNKLKELIDKNYFGEVLSVTSSHGEHIADYHPGEDYKSSYAVSKHKCGGVLLTQIHHIDYLNWLFGPFTHVYASEIQTQSLTIDTESVVNYSLKSEETNLLVQGHMNYLQRPKSTKLSLIGEFGEAIWNYEDNSLNVTSVRGNIFEQDEQERNNMFLMAMADFIESIELSKSPKTSLLSGIQSVRIVESIKQSIVDNQVVLID